MTYRWRRLTVACGVCRVVFDFPAFVPEDAQCVVAVVHGERHYIDLDVQEAP